MGNIIGIDYGQRKIGIAVGDWESKLSQPYKVIRCKTSREGMRKVMSIIKTLDTKEVVVGISENVSAELAKKFAEDLSINTGLRIKYQDETLTTHDALIKSIQAGKKKSVRKLMEDAYAAAQILDNYFADLDNRNS